MANNLPGRVAEMAAVFMIGDGLLGLTQPERHVALWDHQAMGADAVVRPFSGRPALRRAYGAVQLIAGLWLASRQRDRG